MFVPFLFGGFPALIIAAELALFYWIVAAPEIWKFALLIVIPYALPPGVYRMMNAFVPLKEGRAVIDREHYSPWVVSYRIQLIYVLFPFLESALLAFPGLFSVWLRGWGSSVGKRVIFADLPLITDRAFLTIGDNAFFGSSVILLPHAINPHEGHLLLYLKGITIGPDVFVGAGSRFGPGVEVEPGAFVPVLTDLYINQRFPTERSQGAVNG